MNRSPRRGLGALNAVYWILLAIWLGSLVMSGITAGVIFPTMKEMAAHLPKFDAYTGDHWKIAGGAVMAKVFFAGDLIALIAVVGITVITMLHFVVYKLPAARPANAIRTIVLIVLLLSVSYQLFILGPRMNVNLVEYHKAAQAGDNDSVARFEAAFEADHPTAFNVLMGNLICLLVMTASSAVALTGDPTGRTGHAAPSDTRSGSQKTRLEEPALLRPH